MRQPTPIFVYDDSGRLRKAADNAQDAAAFCGVSLPAVYNALNKQSLVKKKFRLFRSREEAEAHFSGAGSTNGAQAEAPAREQKEERKSEPKESSTKESSTKESSTNDTLRKLAQAMRRFAADLETIAGGAEK